MGISAIYASTCYIARRALWYKLQSNFQQYQIPLCCFGDFNTILGAHEYNGSHRPARGLMEDFGRWTDSNHLLHIPTTGARFTWSNSRKSVIHTQKRLDREVCNQD